MRTVEFALGSEMYLGLLLADDRLVCWSQDEATDPLLLDLNRKGGDIRLEPLGDQEFDDKHHRAIADTAARRWHFLPREVRDAVGSRLGLVETA